MERLKRLASSLVARAVKALMSASLFLLYVIGFGLTKALVAVFDRRLLAPRDGAGDTYWLKAEGYELDESELTRGS
jgi:hypothetical protein